MRWVILIATVLVVAEAPARGAVVARDGGAVLRARQSGRELCLRVTRPGREPARQCDASPVSPFQPLVLDGLETGGRFVAAVAGDVDAVGFGTEATEDRRVPTVEANGFEARFIFERRRLPRRVQRFYDGAGDLIGARQNVSRLPQIDPVTLLARSGQKVRVSARLRLAPTPLRPDRFVARACVSGLTNAGGETFCEGGFFGGDIPTLATVRTFRACAPQTTLAYGVTAAQVRAVAFTLGSGRVVRVATRRLPAAYRGARGVAAQLPAGAAVRSARAVGSNGFRQLLSEPPGGLPCPENRSNQGLPAPLYSRPQLDGAVVGRAGDRPVKAGDAPGGALCVGLGDLTAFDCGPPPVDGDPERVLVEDGAVAGAVGAQVATVRVRFADKGPPLDIPTTAGPRYGGRFAGVVRFVAGSMPPGRVARSAVGLDADGEYLGTSRLFDAPRRPPVAPTQRTLLAAGRARLAVTRFENGARCADPLPGAFVFSGFCAKVDGRVIAVAAFCRPRTLLVWGQLGEGDRRVTVVLDDGARIAAETFDALGGRLFGAFVRPGAGLRAVRIGGRRRAFRLPPAARQCGYVDSLL